MQHLSQFLFNNNCFNFIYRAKIMNDFAIEATTYINFHYLLSHILTDHLSKYCF